MTQKFDEGSIKMMQTLLGVGAVAEEMRKRMPPRSAGKDPTGTVEAVIDASGTLLQLSIAPKWRDEVKPADLGATVLAGINAAYSEQLKALGSRPGNFVPPVVSEDDAIRALTEQAHGLDAQAAFAAPIDPTEAAEQYLRMAKQGVPDAPPAPAQGPVVIASQGGRITGVTIEASWAATKSNFAIVGAITEAANKLPEVGPSGAADQGDSLLISLLATLRQMNS
ncbi:MAG: hypothetical protein WAV45_09245 [Propionibacteriaceae bacterium]|nr:hypothetical protein [Micropruina sp.]MBK9159175.1 hypothetical protein [Micropruina sp.]HBX80789.1 hypothetical protein [Propionibacteriaceae bacterium]HBY22194.1 hypothetical protein [Propionibacteriaceae bacterium]